MSQNNHLFEVKPKPFIYLLRGYVLFSQLIKMLCLI